MKKYLIWIFIFSFFLIGCVFAGTWLNLYLNWKFEYLTKNNPLFSWAVLNVLIYDESWTQIWNTKNQEKSAYFPSEPKQTTNTDSKWVIISEVFFNWADEWIELTNIWWETFSWVLSISWVKSSLVKKPFTILPKKSVLIWDNLSQILNKVYIVYSWLGLSIPDTSEINVSLIFSWTEIDNFFVSSWIVKNLQPGISFEKRSIWNSYYTIIWASIDRKINISWDRIANPWFFNDFITGWTISTWVKFDRYEINNLPSKDINIFKLNFLLTTWTINDIFNSYVNPIDTLLINRYYIKLVNLSWLYLKAADVNWDWKVNPIDALLINRYYIKTINNFVAWLYVFEERDMAVCLSSDGITINENEITNCKNKYNTKLWTSAKNNPIILIAILKDWGYLAGSKDTYLNSDSKFFNNDPIYIKTLHVWDVNGGK